MLTALFGTCTDNGACDGEISIYKVFLGKLSKLLACAREGTGDMDTTSIYK